jgi:hypothetical protein
MQGGQSYWFPQLIAVLSFSCSCLTHRGGSVQVWMLSCCSGDQLCNLLPDLLLMWLFAVFVHWEFRAGGLFLCLVLFLWSRLCSTCSLCCPCSVLNAPLWLRRSALWSTTCPALGSGLLPAHCQSLLPFLCLFTDCLALKLAPCPPPFCGAVSAFHPSDVHQFTICKSLLLGIGG